MPQGLGQFYPEATIMCVCKECDTRHGNEFELIALRTGFLSFFRAIYGIKSKNNPKKPIHNPQKDKFNAIESKEFMIQNVNDEKDIVELTRNGNLRFSDEILVLKNEQQIDSIKIPIFDDIRETCNFIQQKTNQKIDGVEYELRTGGETHDAIVKELSRRGILKSNPKFLGIKPKREAFWVRSTFSNNHFRFIASIVLKTMIFVGYEKSLLSYLIDYVDKNDMGNIKYRNIDLNKTGFDALDEPPADIFYHTFNWNLTEDVIKMEASILAHRNVNGFKLHLAVNAGTNKNIIIPYGNVHAKYTESGKGELTICLGERKININEKMKAGHV